MDIYGWDYYELEKEISRATTFELLELYKREKKKRIDKCLVYYNNKSNMTKDEESLLEKECEFHEGAKIKVALKIAETLTKENE
ncbi:hypothetical protein RVS70_05415 [Virgibacillus sp. M23]|uniref:hypothetical protein n=1 Tax=Virgibacillus sp. M23 TaxID=3079030 RepID=UPI002A909277|nr:hypothetical protein [Virgibacillus sp. M23]MDY7043640.1 hypothetical protein [Virgibacillus sp. M23]